MRERTKQEKLSPEERSKHRKHIPTKTVAYHSEEEILKFLGVNIDENEQEVKELLGELDSALWDSTAWGDEEDEAE
jgi:hypothetical protein